MVVEAAVREVVEGAEVEQTGVSNIIQQTTLGGKHPVTLTHPHLGRVSAIGSLASQASYAWNLKHVPGNSTSNQDLKIEGLTSSRRKTRKQMTIAYTACCIMKA